MKHILLFFTLAISLSFAQQPRAITVVELETLKKEVVTEASVTRYSLEQEDYMSAYDKEISINFKIDTLKVELLLRKKLDIDYSTSGMVNATYEAETDYDLLLNKYYNLVLKKLADQDKEALKQTQRNWIKFRDSERKLNSLLVNDSYSGGGTIQGVIKAGNYLELTKSRVIMLYDYLGRFYE